MRTFARAATAAFLAFAFPTVLQGQQPTVTPISGTVEIQRPGEAFRPLTEVGSYPGAAVVRTGADGFALVRYADSTEVVVRPASEVRIGGEEEQGVLVLLGKVLLRVRRLLTPGQERTHRTPTTVAAVRGTEFGLAVDASGRTRVFVFEGRVAVSNVELAGQEVEVDAGRMTEVDLRRTPTRPRAFTAGEFEGGAGGEVERGEDRAVESGQAPVALRWLAFPDADLDALENPAYLSAGPRSGVSAVAFGELAGGGAHVERDGRRTPLVEDAVHRGLGQALSRSSRGGLTLALFAQGDVGLDRAERAVRPPGSAVSDFFNEETRWKVAEGRVLGAWTSGRTSLGLGVSHRRGSLDAESAPAAEPSQLFTSNADNDVTTFTAGLRTGVDRTLGLAVHHSRINSTTDASDHAELSNRLWAVEGLARVRHGGAWWAGWLRAERTTGGEDRTLPGGGFVYREDVDIRTVRLGVGLGLRPTEGAVVSVDLAAGVADESAIQTDAAGVILEDEEDLRLSASVHLGTQLTVSGPWRVELSVLHAVEHIDRDFVINRDVQGGVMLDVRSVFGTRGTAGVIYAGRGWTGRYAVSASPEAGRPWIHSLLVAVSPR